LAQEEGNTSLVTPGGLLLFAGLVVGQLVVAQWIDLHPILLPTALVCALISVGALIALFVGPVEAVSASHRKLIARSAAFGLIFAISSFSSFFFAYQIKTLGWLRFALRALPVFLGVTGGFTFHRQYRRR
jgi:UDP-N-acetylmuramyl pentapeptide phosphotransferase/UDP-N-acetylglucosamine-1-phosphate transferase